MKIIGLKTENIKNLKVVQIHPDEESNVVMLTGKMGAGKSAILESIEMALTGKVIQKPIREGEDRAEVIVNLGDYIVKKVFTKKGNKLEVYNTEGAKYPSPQALLDKILGDLTFDPLSFSRMKEKEQLELLKKLVGLDFSDLDKTMYEKYEQRTFINREIKELDGQFKSFIITQEELPEEELSLKDELQKLRKMEEQDKKHNEFQQKGIVLLESTTEKRKRIKKLQDMIVVLEGEIEDNGIKLEELERIAPAEVLEDKLQKARDFVESIELKNKKIRDRNEYNRIKQVLEEKRKISEELSIERDNIQLEKVKRIKNCKFPVKNLSIDENIVLYEGKPFKQLSSGEQVMISTAIAMTLNPTLKVILIREGSLLDSRGLGMVAKAAQNKDYQVWIEKVDETGECGIYIEEGEIKNG